MCGSLSIAICEDVPSERELLLSLARDWARGAGAHVSLEAFASAEALVFHRAGGKEFDLLLLDIGMRGMSGMELARELRAQGCGAQIVFITGYADCMSGMELARGAPALRRWSGAPFCGGNPLCRGVFPQHGFSRGWHAL